MAPARIYHFGDFCLDTGKRLLKRRDGSALSLNSRAYDTLVYLVEHAGMVLDEDDMMRALWPSSVVEENNLSQSVSVLRRALAEGHAGERYISTVSGRGYQFVATVKSSTSDGAGGDVPEHSIAVLPFANLSSDPDYDYFAAGLAEELINALARLEKVRVAARRSSFFYKDSATDVRQIAQQLGVAHLLEGNIRRCGTKLRITAQLINAVSGYQLWSERYERDAEIQDLFKVQDEITCAIVDALKLTMKTQESSRAPKKDFRAYELYLQGQVHLSRMSAAGIRCGLAYLERAIEADPSDAHAHVGLAHAYRHFALSLELPTDTYMAKAKETAQAAIRLDPMLAEAHAVLGFTIFWAEWRWEIAERHMRHALDLNDRSSDSHWMLAHLYSNTGRHQEALAEMLLSRQLDPLSGHKHAMEGRFLLFAGRVDDAIDRLHEALDLEPSSRVGHSFLANACIEKGLFEEAVTHAQAAIQVCPGNSDAISIEAYAKAKMGKESEAQATLNHLISLSRERYVSPTRIAVLCNGLGQTEQALNWLESAFQQRDPRMVDLKCDPRFQNLQLEPRFVKLVQKMGFPD